LTETQAASSADIFEMTSTHIRHGTLAQPVHPAIHLEVQTDITVKMGVFQQGIGTAVGILSALLAWSPPRPQSTVMNAVPGRAGATIQ